MSKFGLMVENPSGLFLIAMVFGKFIITVVILNSLCHFRIAAGRSAPGPVLPGLVRVSHLCNLCRTARRPLPPDPRCFVRRGRPGRRQSADPSGPGNLVILVVDGQFGMTSEANRSHTVIAHGKPEIADL